MRTGPMAVTGHMRDLVSCGWLKAHLNDPGLIVIDCTNSADWCPDHHQFETVSGRAHWLAGHIPGSQHADFAGAFSNTDKTYRNALPDPQMFCAALGALGVGAHTRVILYDSGQSMWAARVWWMLRWVGFDNAAVLDGGWSHWQSQGGEIHRGEYRPKPAALQCKPKPSMFVSRSELQAAMADGQTILIDALSAAQFAGTDSDLGLSGHIPEAVNVPGSDMVDPVTNLFRNPGRLAPLFPDDLDRPVIVYCGSGIAAASVVFVMVQLGHTNLSIYMPGLQEWRVTDGQSIVHG